MDYCSAAIEGEKITIISNRDFWIESFWATSRYLWLKAIKKLTLEFLSGFVGHNPDWTVTNFNLNFTISGCHGYSFDHLFFSLPLYDLGVIFLNLHRLKMKLKTIYIICYFITSLVRDVIILLWFQQNNCTIFGIRRELVIMHISSSSPSFSSSTQKM